MNFIILAGGRGTRLWPMSRRQKPKHLYNILTDRAMIVDVYNRLSAIAGPEKIFIATLPDFVEQIKELLPNIASDQLLTEPGKRDCAPARALASLVLAKRGLGDEPVAFIPTDHYIGDEDRFRQVLKVGSDLIEETGKMLDISVAPQFPSTALGYTKIGEKFRNVDGIDIFYFEGHKEKPDQETALKYIESGQYLWHANYYMWTPNKFLAAYKQYAPEIYDLLLEIDDAPTYEEQKAIYDKMPSISFDYAIAEKMNPEDVLIIRGDFSWWDIGSWNILYDRLKLKNPESENVTKGQVVEIDTKNCLVYSKNDKVIALIGARDLVVVDTDDALLICPQSRSQEVKDIVQLIKERGLNDFL